MANFKFQKTVLVVSATAAMAGMLVGGQALAQSNTEKGSIDITAKVINSTCVLALDTTASTAGTAASKTLDLGTFSVATVSSITPTTFIRGASVVLSLKEANGSTAGCAAISTGKWDVSIDLPATAYSTTNLSNNHTLNNTTTGAAAATGVAARLLRATNSGGVSEILIANKVAGYGYLLSGSTTTPNLNNTDTVTLTAELFKLSTGAAVAAGAYTANVPLTVVYK